NASARIYDVRGRLVAVCTGAAEGGVLVLTWDGDDRVGQAVANGLYFVRIGTGEEITSLKIVRAERPE
ncbi:MAG: hypothetical protein FD129_913, partial [bacterium]